MASVTNRLEKIIKSSVEEVVGQLERPFGLLLSGGVDSAFLAALTKPDLVFTCRFPGSGERYDEFVYAEMVAKELKLKQEIIDIKKEDFENNLCAAVKTYGKITTHFSLVPLYLAMKRAKEMGFKTLLSGEGPDEYLGGYASYSILVHEQELYDIPQLKNYKPLIDKYLGTPMARFARILGKDPKVLIPHWDVYDELLSKVGYTDLKLRGIEEMELALAKGFGLNLVYPYMTDDIEQFCFRKVPDKIKIHKNVTKFCFRKIAEKYIPFDVAWRKHKMGGPVFPVGKLLNTNGDEFDKTEYIRRQKQCLSQ